LFTFILRACYRSLKVIDLENTLFSKSSHRCLQICTFCFPQISTKMCFVFVLGTKNSSGHVQTNFFLEKFPTFCVGVIPSPLSSYGVSTLFPLPFHMARFKKRSHNISFDCSTFFFYLHLLKMLFSSDTREKQNLR